MVTCNKLGQCPNVEQALFGFIGRLVPSMVHGRVDWKLTGIPSFAAEENSGGFYGLSADPNIGAVTS